MVNLKNIFFLKNQFLNFIIEGLFRDEDPTHVDKLKFYEFSGSVLGVNRVVDIDRIM